MTEPYDQGPGGPLFTDSEYRDIRMRADQGAGTWVLFPTAATFWVVVVAALAAVPVVYALAVAVAAAAAVFFAASHYWHRKARPRALRFHARRALNDRRAKAQAARTRWDCEACDRVRLERWARENVL